MSQSYALSYRGRITGLAANGCHVAFVTRHPEQHATALYHIDTSNPSWDLQSYALPCSASALINRGEDFWLTGLNGKLYHANLPGGKLRSVVSFAPETTDNFSPALGLALLADNHLAILQAEQLTLVDLANKRISQQLALPGTAHTLAASDDGLWLAVGATDGVISTWQLEQGQLSASAQALLHQGSVTALLFEPRQQRFYSASDDKKLLSTHAQGELQALDKGKNSNHSGTITALTHGPERLYTGSNDQSIKAWPAAGGQPTTYKQGLAKVSHLCLCQYLDKPHLLVASEDAKLRWLALDEDGKPVSTSLTISDAYHWAQILLQEKNQQRQVEALKVLAQFDDLATLELLAKQLKNETDKASRVQLVQVLCASRHDKALLFLEDCLKDSIHDSVRLAAFDSLSQRAAQKQIPDPLRHCQKALETGLLDIGALALRQLADHTRHSAQALQLLTQALSHDRRELRYLALSLLEQLSAVDDPKASLQALQTSHTDLQQAALIRLYQRRLLDNMEVQRTVVLLQDHNYALVRQTALWVAIAARPALAESLSQKDESWARPLQDLKNFQLLDSAVAGTGLLASIAAMFSSTPKLTPDDLTPLLQGMTSRHADICFHSAYGLAVLHDQRAFGVLLLLAQEPSESIRAGVCRALANLGQSEGKTQLEVLLNDENASVRDAAFTSYGVLENDALRQADIGLRSKHQDIHSRALKVLLDALASLPAARQDNVRHHLLAALNDPFEAIRQETVKACLNRQLAGDRAQTLQLLLGSQYQNVHQEVLNEWMAQAKNSDALSLFGDLVNDNFAAIRSQALNFALQEKKLFAVVEVLPRAIASRFLDSRQAALQHMAAKPAPEFQPLLLALLTDDDRELRLTSLKLLQASFDPAVLTQALACRHDDIQVVAAHYCAQRGDERAYAVLHDFASRTKPEQDNLVGNWKSNVKTGLTGLAALADPRAFEVVRSHISAKDKELALAAATTLPWLAHADQHTTLTAWLADERAEIRAYSALALALLGDCQVLPVLQDKAVINVLSAHERLAALTSLQQVSPPALLDLFNHNATAISSQLVLFSHELLLNTDSPRLSSWALAVKQPSLQLLASAMLSNYHDLSACWQVLQQWLQSQQQSGQDKNWQIPVAELQQLAAVLVFADAKVRARLCLLLNQLDQKATGNSWQVQYQAFTQRYSQAVQAASAKAGGVEKAPANSQRLKQAQHWQQLAFGACVGLIRLSTASLALNLSAIRQLLQLAELNPDLKDGVSQCLMPLLNHSQQALRQLAFDALQQLGLGAEQLGQTAITSVQADIVKLGLELLIAHYPAKQAQALLQRLIQTSSAILATEGWRLLCQHNGLYATAPLALTSYYLPLRQQCVAELAGQYQDDEAQKLLRTACSNDHRPTAIAAASVLARQQHADAFSLLQPLLSYSADADEQQQLLRCLRQLSEAQIALWLSNYLDNPQLRVDMAQVYETIGRYRAPESVTPLLARLNRYPDQLSLLHKTIVTISGYDQRIADYDDQSADQSWQERQYPRHDAVLCQWFEKLIQRQDYKLAQSLLRDLAWMKSAQADSVLLAAVPKMPAEQLPELVSAISRRAWKRQGRIEGLLDCLSHKNPDVQFMAAEGLARSGKHQGNSVLLAAIDYQTNANYRQRAVLALGESGDERALEKLLQLAEEAGHFLQDVAIEAIGHLGQSPQAEHILRVIKRPLKDDSASIDLIKRALHGLRWFNTTAAWQHICSYIEDESRNDTCRVHAIKLLQYWHSDACRDLLLKLLREQDNESLVRTALNSARFLSPIEAKQAGAVDYALVQGHYPLLDNGDALQRICLFADTGKLLDLVVTGMHNDAHTDNSPVQEQLRLSLLQRSDQHAERLEFYLDSHNGQLVALVGQLLARLSQLPASTAQALDNALNRYHRLWTDWQHSPLQHRRQQAQQTQAAHTSAALHSLLWAAAKQRSASPVIPALLADPHSGSLPYQQTFLQALLAHGDSKTLSASWLTVIGKLGHSPAPVLRQLANQVLAQQQTDAKALDWHAFVAQPQRLARDFQPQVQQAAGTADQTQVLPVLIAQHDIATLNQVAANTKAEEWLRLGAIEGLARMALADAEACLQALQQDSDEDIRKAAFRALRRSQRLRAKAQTGTGTGAQA